MRLIKHKKLKHESIKENDTIIMKKKQKEYQHIKMIAPARR